jgi:malonyl CoA-acyl carrier protein transacylase
LRVLKSEHLRYLSFPTWTPDLTQTPEEIRQLLIQQVLSPVRWEESVRFMLSSGCTDFYEVGPGNVLRGLLKRMSRKSPCTLINDSFEDGSV